MPIAKTKQAQNECMSTETEIKLRLPPQFAHHIKQLSLLKNCSISTPVCYNLYSIYYDSPNLYLKKHHISLRTRKIDHQWIQTIKSGGKIRNGLHQHNEWEYPIANEAPDFSKIDESGLKDFFADPQLRQSLEPVFVTDFNRTIYLLEPAKKFKLEFCLDEGKINANQKSQTISEIELELKTGDVSQLIQFSETLQDHCPFPLFPENTNKAMRGYMLLAT